MAHFFALLLRDRPHDAGDVLVAVSDWRCCWWRCWSRPSSSIEKIANKSSFGIIDTADDSSTSDRIIVIVDTACLIDDGARQWLCGLQTNSVSGSH